MVESAFVNGQGYFMKAVILAGGLGTRLSEETVTKPKPMVEIGGKPILWIHNTLNINARNWQSWGSRNSKDLNQNSS